MLPYVYSMNFQEIPTFFECETATVGGKHEGVRINWENYHPSPLSADLAPGSNSYLMY